MEKKLQHQLNRLEYKPSDSLWSKIENQLPDDFDLHLESQLEEFSITPSASTWSKIESALPEEKKSPFLFRILSISLVLLLLSASAYLFKLSLTNNSPSTSEQIENPESHTHNIIKSQKPITSSTLQNETPESNRTGLQPNLTHKNLPVVKPAEPSLVQKATPKSAVVRQQKTANQQPITSVRNIAKKQQELENNIASNTTTNQETASTETASIIPAEHLDSNVVVAKNNITLPSDSSSIAVHVKTPFIEEKKVINNTDEDKPTRFSISVITGANYCFNHLAAPSNASSTYTNNIDLRNNIEKPEIDWAGTFMIDYQLTDRLSFSAGIGILNFNQTFTYNTTKPTSGGSTIEKGNSLINANDSIVSGNGLSTRIKYSWTEIPLLLTYKITQNPRFNMELSSGISYAVLSTVDAGMVSYDNVGVLLVKDKSAFPVLQNNFFISIAPALTYKLNNLVTLGIMPTAKVSMSSMINNTNWVQQYPYFIGVSASLRKRF